MTLADILSNGYGIDISTLKFETISGEDTRSKEEILKSIKEDDIIMNGRWIDDFDIVPDEPAGYIELYCTEDDLLGSARFLQ